MTERPLPTPAPGPADHRRALPAVGAVLELPAVRALQQEAPRSLVTDAVRRVIDRARTDPSTTPAGEVEWGHAVQRELAWREIRSLRPLLNATGVVLHTNLGRAPLARAAIDAITQTAATGSNLEYDLEAGARGSRYVHCASLLCDLTGAEDALVVNNGAAALVLALNTLAEGRDAVVSRGELIEIGGSFRVPDIMARSGAILREVGTTNRTHPDDYRRALSAQTGALVKVHRSNFEQRGFVAEASLADLVPIAREAAVPLLFDFGSGLLLSLERYGLRGEPTARDGVRDGATLMVMSGDKMLGGPQAGLVVGSRDAVAACRRNPLARALRVDKLTLAALEATLVLYRDPERAVREIPALAMLTAPPEAVRARAEHVAARLREAGVSCDAIESEATVGGGAFPTARLASWSVSPVGNAEELERRLRGATIPVIGRISEGRLLLDLRSVWPPDDEGFAEAIGAGLTAS
ncbi:MAG TPA: L-seryl-tRNA(Sec) selenium transferase [Gemmatimonadaceae bacterium]|nr:L-seryl-tRNA(Sec) selenium transferase [Gemmatimonadaceae bacterium]